MNFQPELNRSVGENVVKYFDLWREDRGGGLTENAAARRLLGHLPMAWGDWASVVLEDIKELDHHRASYTNFLRFVSLIITHRIQTLTYPYPSQRFDYYEEEVAPPLLPVGHQMYPPRTPSPLPPSPFIFSPSPSPPRLSPSYLTLNTVPESAYYPEPAYYSLTHLSF